MKDSALKMIDECSSTPTRYTDRSLKDTDTRTHENGINAVAKLLTNLENDGKEVSASLFEQNNIHYLHKQTHQKFQLSTKKQVAAAYFKQLQSDLLGELHALHCFS